jgi:DNA repair protein RadC
VKIDNDDLEVFGAGAGNKDSEPQALFHKDRRSPQLALTEFLESIAIPSAGVAARNLIAEFGSVSDILAASWWTLLPAVGLRTASIILASRNLMRAALFERFERRPIVPRSRELIEFLHAEIGSLKHERLLALYVDSQSHLLRIRKISDGGPTATNMNFRKIIAAGLSVGASGFLLVHNHPSGDPRPSSDDLAATHRLKRLAEEVGLHLLDHLIIARGRRVGSIFDFFKEAEWAPQEMPRETMNEAALSNRPQPDDF